MESFTSAFGVFSFAITAIGAVIIVIDFFLPKNIRIKLDYQIKDMWIKIDDKKVSTLIKKYSLWIKNLYTSPAPTSKRRERHKKPTKRKMIDKKNTIVVIAFVLPVLAIIIVHLTMQDNFLFFNFPNLFDQYYTISGNLSIVVASGMVNLLIFKLLEKTFNSLVKTDDLKLLWLVVIIALFFLGFTEPIMTVATSFFFHLFFSIEIFFFPNIPPFYLWNPSLAFERLVSYQWNPSIFVLHSKLFFEELKPVIDNLWIIVIYTPRFYLSLFRSGGLSISTFMIDAISLALGYLPLIPAILFLALATILLAIKNLLNLTSLALTSLVEYIMNKEISEENSRGKAWVERKEYDPTLRFIGKQLVNFGVILLTIFSVFAYFYPFVTPK